MRRSPFALTLLIVPIGVMAAPSVVATHGQLCVFDEQQKLTASDASEGDRFGNCVSISGDWAIVGAYLDDVAEDMSGSAYVYRRDDSGTPSDPNDDFWVEGAKLTAFDASAGDRFGSSVSISGHRIVVGAPLDDNAGWEDSGSAYVFRRDDEGTPSDPSDDTWVEEAKLMASDAAAQDAFGRAVSISGGRVVVGAWGDDEAGTQSGSAYVFRCDDNSTPLDPSDDFWIEAAKLTASDAAAQDWFGRAVSISGDRVVVGASGGDEAGAQSGSAYVFRCDDNSTPLDPSDDFWIEAAKLTASDAAAQDGFGGAVSISGGRVVVGGWGDSASAYVFRRDDNGTPLDPNDDSWVEEDKLTALGVAADDGFGGSVSMNDDRVVVGATGYSHAAYSSGSAFVFRRDDNGSPSDPSDDFWIQQAMYVASDAHRHAQFGRSVGISGDRAIVGAWFDNDAGVHSGSAYVFAVRVDTGDDCNANAISDDCEEDCNGNAIPDDCDVVTGSSEDCTSNGIPDECEPDCNGNDVADSCDIADGTSEDCSSDGIPDECDPDCNANGIADSCDIYAGTSGDCNHNRKPDECDIADATSEDVNGDGVPDSCHHIRWRPVAAEKYVVCLPGEDPCGETQIMLSGGGTLVTLFLELSGWDQDQDGDPLLGAYQGTVNSESYRGGLGPNEIPGHPGNPGTVPGVDLHPSKWFLWHLRGASMALKVCAWDPLDPIGSSNMLSECQTTADCPIGWLCVDRWDYMFYQVDHTPVVSTARYDYSWGGASTDCAADDGTFKYGGTLRLEVPYAATGTYNVALINDLNFTLVNTCEGPLIPGLSRTYGQITIVKGRCCSNIGVGTTVCEDDLSWRECNGRPGPTLFTPLESCSGSDVTDCNNNGIPDECDIVAEDCNGNAVPDDCDPDSDGDGVIDECDGCPDDPNKTEPGICGCGFDDDGDSDGDDVPDCIDQCPGVDDSLFAPSCEDAIPTLSAWGFAVLTLLLLVGGKVYFARRRITPA